MPNNKRFPVMPHGALTFFLIAFLGLLPLKAAAYDIPLDAPDSLGKVNRIIGRNIDNIYREAAIKKEDARIKKMEITAQFENQFENYKLDLRNMGNEISLLTELKENCLKIQDYERQIIASEKRFKKKVENFFSNNSDVYIPVIYAAFIELPIKDDATKDTLINDRIQTRLLRTHGVSNLIASTQLADNKLIEASIRSRKAGMLEQDGIRGFDGNHLINFLPDKTKYIRTSFYRFKPFASSIPMNGKRKENTAGKDPTPRIRLWDMTAPDGFANIKRFINKEFSDDTVRYIDDLEKYVDSLRSTHATTRAANQRVTKILKKFEYTALLHKKNISSLEANIDNLKTINRSLQDELHIGNISHINAIDALIRKKRAEKSKREKEFEYTFIVMADKESNNFRTAIRQSIEEIFTKLEAIISKQSISIETIISNGALVSYEKNQVSFSQTFSDLFVQKYVSGRKAGVLLSLTVKYSRNGSKHHEPTPPKNEFTETARNLNIRMKYIRKAGAAKGFYISKSPISKAQFVTFLDSTGQSIATVIPNERSRSSFRNYPADYPMKYITKQNAKEFTSWLSKVSRMKYSLPKKEELITAAKKSRSFNKGMRVVCRDLE